MRAGAHIPGPRASTMALRYPGKTHQRIADRLEISIKTVQAHRASIMERLGLGNVAHFVCFAIGTGILSLTRDTSEAYAEHLGQAMGALERCGIGDRCERLGNSSSTNRLPGGWANASDLLQHGRIHRLAFALSWGLAFLRDLPALQEDEAHDDHGQQSEHA